MDEKMKLQSWYLKQGAPKPVETRHFATLDELIQHTKEISKEIEQVREHNKRCLQLYKDDYYKWTEAIYSTDDAEELKRLNPVLTSHILAMKGFMDREHNSETQEEYQKQLNRYNELKDALNERLESFPQALKKIDAERLGAYFVPAFKGQGNGKINYFSEMVEDLKKERTAKEFGQIALMIWNSPHGNSRLEEFEHFSKWYYDFCQCVGCEHKTYDKNKLKYPSKALKSLFSYL